MKFFKFIPYILFAGLILVVFKSWFFSGLIAGGDLSFFYNSYFKHASIGIFTWDMQRDFGLGGNTVPFLWSYLIVNLPILILGKLNFSWEMIERIVLLYPFLVIAFASPFYFAKKLMPDNKFILLTPFILIFNTYTLMVVAGGQMQIALSFGLMPAVFYFFMSRLDLRTRPLDIFIASILLSLQVMYDIRIAFITAIITLLFYCLKALINRKVYLDFFVFFLIPVSLSTFLIQAFWIIPLILGHSVTSVAELGSQFSTTDAVKFFSFAKFENSISLLHPLWPENIFGKVSFMKPEFLIIPIIAYSPLLFLKKKSKEIRYIVFFFAFLGILGAFLAKGASEPFGFIYIWLFKIPGFSLFRDPTKWYTMVILSYSILIPFAVNEIFLLAKNIKTINKYAFALLFSGAFLIGIFLAREAFFGQIKGTLVKNEIPIEYQEFADYISAQPKFFRTFWFPASQRFSYSSQNHPFMQAQNLYSSNDLDKIIKLFDNPSSEKLLKNASVKYVVVPYDAGGEIFLTDRKYDDRKYQSVVRTLEHIKWLKNERRFGKLVFFEVSSPRDHFWSNSTMSISYSEVNPALYDLSISNAEKDDLLVFSENFDPGWRIESKNQEINSRVFDKYFNSFIVPSNRSFNAKVEYQPQKLVDMLIFVSLGVFVATLFAFLYFVFKKRK